MPNLTIALAKGRLQIDALEIFSRAGVRLSPEQLNSRRLMVSDLEERYNFVFVKPSDVPVYVEYGTADAGICGLDVLMEQSSDVHRPLDLQIGRCRIAVAGRKHEPERGCLSTLRVATKYPHITSQFFQQKGLPVEVIKLSGSIELAPLLGLSDRIVDLVETGRTLEENGLEVKEIIAETTAQLIVNRVSFQMKRPVVTHLIDSLTEALKGKI